MLFQNDLKSMNEYRLLFSFSFFFTQILLQLETAQNRACPEKKQEKKKTRQRIFSVFLKPRHKFEIDRRE